MIIILACYVNAYLSIVYQGLSVCSALIDGEKYLLAFGGYNGRYSNEVCDVTSIYHFSDGYGSLAFLIYFCQERELKF